MTTKLKWRLGKLPTPEEVSKLVNDKIITKDEARDILFNEVDESKRDEESLKEEIKFLKELVSKLSSRGSIVESIRYIQAPYYHSGWYGPYMTYCTAGSNTLTATGITTTSGASGVSSLQNYSSTSGTANTLATSGITLASCSYDSDQDGSDFAAIISI